MGHTITARLTPKLAEWLSTQARESGVPAGRIIREQLEKAKAESGARRFLRHARKINGTDGSVGTQEIQRAMNLIADTGFIVAFGNRNDSHHDWAIRIAKDLTEPAIT